MGGRAIPDVANTTDRRTFFGSTVCVVHRGQATGDLSGRYRGEPSALRGRWGDRRGHRRAARGRFGPRAIDLRHERGPRGVPRPVRDTVRDDAHIRGARFGWVAPRIPTAAI